MGDLKLFKLDGSTASEVASTSVALEKSLQTIIENNLQVMFGITMLASEYPTGKTHGGRIDTLGLDENYCAVIFEYKRSTNENVINQGLYYLDWLMDHQAELEQLAVKKLGPSINEKIDWSAPRLLCIAGDFTKYDEYAVQQIDRNIELYRYRKFGQEVLLLELVNSQVTGSASATVPTAKPGAYKSPLDHLQSANDLTRDRFEALKAFLLGLADDVQVSYLKWYISFKRIKNFACVVIYPQQGKLLVYLKIDPKSVTLENGYSRDVSDIGHHGVGDLEITIASDLEFEKSKPLLIKSYELS